MQSDSVYIGSAASGLYVGKKQLPITKVVCDCGNDTIITVGDDFGSVMDVSCEWGDQKNVQAMLDSLLGFRFLPYEAENALINPAFEIGDAVHIKGYYSGIWNIDVKYGPVLTADLEAGDEELDHEYPVATEKKRTVSKRELASGSVSIGGGGIKSETVKKSALTYLLQKSIDDVKEAAEITSGSKWADTIGAASINCNNLLFNNKIYKGTQELTLCTVNTNGHSYQLLGVQIY